MWRVLKWYHDNFNLTIFKETFLCFMPSPTTLISLCIISSHWSEPANQLHHISSETDRSRASFLPKKREVKKKLFSPQFEIHRMQPPNELPSSTSSSGLCKSPIASNGNGKSCDATTITLLSFESFQIRKYRAWCIIPLEPRYIIHQKTAEREKKKAQQANRFAGLTASSWRWLALMPMLI